MRDINITMWVVRLQLLKFGNTYEIHRKGLVLEGDNKYRSTFTHEEAATMPRVKHFEIINTSGKYYD